MKKLFRNRDIKVIILEVFLIVLGLVGLTLGVKYIMNSINVNVDTSKLAIDNMNASVSNGTLTPIEDSSVNINTTSNVLRITFDVKGASTNTGNNIIYDAILNIDADCSLKNESVKWNLYKNNNLLTSGSTSPKYDRDVLNGKITLTDTQQDLVKYSGSADKYVFILWMSESCNEEDITKCDLSNALTSDSGGKSISGNIDIRLNSGKKKENKRETMDIDACSIPRGNAANAIMKLDDGSDGDEGSGVYKVSHDAIPASSSATGSEIPAVTDYRYYGASPNNYICLDMEGQSTCPDKHLYRIIGSIYEEKENTNRIKVIKATPLTDGTTSKFSWDYKVNNGNSSFDNIWATITSGNYSNSLTSGSTLMQLLNSGAWWNGTSGSYYNHSTTATTVNFTNYKLSDKAKSYITTSRYYLGGYNTSRGVMTNQFYTYERGTARYGTDRPLYWEGMVGLMYPSDYGYAAGSSCATGTGLYFYDRGCKNKDWLNSNISQWLMFPKSDFSINVFFLNLYGFVENDSYNGVYIVRSVRPTFYLTFSTFITLGTGTLTDPYILG